MQHSSSGSLTLRSSLVEPRQRAWIEFAVVCGNAACQHGRTLFVRPCVPPLLSTILVALSPANAFQQHCPPGRDIDSRIQVIDEATLALPPLPPRSFGLAVVSGGQWLSVHVLASRVSFPAGPAHAEVKALGPPLPSLTHAPHALALALSWSAGMKSLTGK